MVEVVYTHFLKMTFIKRSTQSIAILVMAIFLITFSQNSLAKQSLLIIKTNNDSIEQIQKGLVSELESEFNINELSLTKRTKFKTIHKALRTSPNALIILGNTALKQYHLYQKKYYNSREFKDTGFPTAIVMGALHAELVSHEMENVIVISYEVPAFTSVMNLKSLYKKPVKKVGIIHREWQKTFIEKSIKYCALESIELIPFVLPDSSKDTVTDIKKTLANVKSSALDALILTNDNILINPYTMRKAWLPALNHFTIPTVVGIEALASNQAPLGDIAIFPDHEELGRQGADKVFDLANKNWRSKSENIELPFSVKKTVNLKTLQKHKIKKHYIKSDSIDTIIR